LTAFKQLVVDVELVTALHIDNFETQLAYTQTNVPAHTDSSLVVRASALRLSITSSLTQETCSSSYYYQFSLDL
jgi:hypothetical protein